MDINSFLETALWSTIDCYGEETDNDNDMLDSNFSIYNVSDEFKAKCELIMEQFMDKARHLFTDEELETGHIEHDLWLTIHGHGAGFWDGDYEKDDEITEIAHEFSELEDELRDDLYRNKE